VKIERGWRRVAIEPNLAFAIPSDAARGEGSPIDSTAGFFHGDGYRIAFDIGRFGEDLGDYAREQEFVRTPRTLADRSGTEVAFVPSDEQFGWARVAQVEAGDGRTLTVRVSCDTRELCAPRTRFSTA
jgi:hypothetical protein